MFASLMTRLVIVFYIIVKWDVLFDWDTFICDYPLNVKLFFLFLQNILFFIISTKNLLVNIINLIIISINSIINN